MADSDTIPGEPEEEDPLLGKIVGNYKILKVLGKGGMGAVYLAEHPIIGSKVAIKFLHPQFAADKRVVDRFFNEAKAVNLIGHPNILKILDLSVTDDKRHYFVMEFLHGGPLSKIIEPGGTSLEVTGPILLQACAALQAAHDHNIIHRDLKPDNIYLVSHLGRRNFVKVVDFGIAKLVEPDGTSGRTQTGTVMGTPAYMSPEQASGDIQNIDGRSDVYSLGIIMFQMACGRLPFDEGTFGKLLVAQMMKEPPAPRSLNPDIPEAYEAIILSTLAKQREDRPQSMAELSDQIHTLMEELGLSAELPADDAPVAGGPGAPRVPSDPGRRRTPGPISGPKLTPPARMRTAEAAPTPRPRSIPPTQAPAPRKSRALLYGIISFAAVALLGAGGAFFAGAFDEARPAPSRRAPKPVEAEKASEPPPAAEAAVVPAPQRPAAEKPPEPEKPAEAAPQRAEPAAAEPAAPAEPKETKRRAESGIRLDVVSDPPQADVTAEWSSGHKSGKTPFHFNAPKGARVKVRVTLKGYSPAVEEVTADEPHTVSLWLVQFVGG